MTPKERAAKAIRKALNTADRLDCTDEDDVYQAVANAALAAIAEPSDPMIGQMMIKYSYLDPGRPLTHANARELWRAAHAAMMAEKDALK